MSLLSCQLVFASSYHTSSCRLCSYLCSPWPLASYQDNLCAVIVSRLRPALPKGVCLSLSFKLQTVVQPPWHCTRWVLQSVRILWSPSLVLRDSLEYLCFWDFPFVRLVPTLGTLPCQGPGPGDSDPYSVLPVK